MKNDPFLQNVADYEIWFEKNRNIYLSELETIRSLIHPGLKGIEIGVGTGRFAGPLGIRTGVEPSPEMAKIARLQGIDVIDAKAESLPIDDGIYDFVLLVTTICFVDNPRASLLEARRILKKDGFILIGFVDRGSLIGRSYQERKNESKFYRSAKFYSVGEITELLEKSGFHVSSFKQTLFEPDNELNNLKVQKAIEGHGKGGFVAIKAGRD